MNLFTVYIKENVTVVIVTIGINKSTYVLLRNPGTVVMK
jgi:hypothetical protein